MTVQVKGDLLAEIDENYFLDLTNAVNATIADPRGVGTIIDDDGEPTLSIDDVTVTEGNSGSVNAVFSVSLSAASGQTVSVGYATADGTAIAGSDYVAAGGNLVFTPGQLTKTVTIQVTGDTLDEIDEAFTVNLSDAVHAVIADGTGVGTILDNDPFPTVSVNNATVTEGDAGTVDATFTVSLNTPSSRTITVDYATADGSATSPADYTAAAGTLTFSPGQTTKTVTVHVNGDLLDEVNETFTVNLSNPSNVTIGDGEGLGTITDNDPLPAVAVDDVTVSEGDSGTVAATFTLSLNVPSGRSLSVDYATADVTATSPADYLAAGGTVTFAPGETSKQVTVLVNGDLLDEANETFRVDLSNPVNATIADGQGTGTITDDDPPVAISVDDASVLEGNFGIVSATFTVSLSSRQRPVRQRRLRDRERDRHSSGRLPGRDRDAHLRSRPDDEAGDRARQRRPARRSERDLLPQPVERSQRNDCGRPGPRHDHERRRPTEPVRQRRNGDRRRLRHDERHLHRHAGPSQWAERECGLLDRGWYGDRTRRLRRDEWRAHVRPGPDHAAP